MPPLHGPLREIVPAERVRERIDALAGRVAADCGGRPLAVVVIDEGARRFAGALLERLRERSVQPDVHHLRVRRTSGARLADVRVERAHLEVERRDVLVVDDIVDEGRTLEAVVGLVDRGGARSIRVAVLVDKAARRAVPVRLDYVGFEVPDGWVVGMGMDLNGRYRDLDHIAVAEGVEELGGIRVP